jgi:uncharacterized protein YqjF (DUF2071 family)
MHQIWNDLLFAHWPIEIEVLHPFVPPELPLDTFEGRCWVAVTPFWMSGVRSRGLPPLPGLSRFPELNVRTYVTVGGKSGVYFFSLDAANLPAVWAARKFYHLPYFHARMSTESHTEWITYESSRHGMDAEFRGRYRPIRPVELRPERSLERWLTERYCLYTVFKGDVFRAEIHHAQWPLQDAEAEIRVNSMASAAHIPLPDMAPVLHFCRSLQVLIWPLERVPKTARI